jgi:hypothetical protein
VTLTQFVLTPAGLAVAFRLAVVGGARALRR